jgi:hypothetical protein
MMIETGKAVVLGPAAAAAASSGGASGGGAGGAPFLGAGPHQTRIEMVEAGLPNEGSLEQFGKDLPTINRWPLTI